MRIAFIILLSIFALCWAQFATQDASASNLSALEPSKTSLQLNAISTDNIEPNLVKQIVFEFNQNIAVIGAVPSQQQINSIQMSHSLGHNCTWRFVDLQRLACELSDSLRAFTQYDIRISPEFSALNLNLDTKNSQALSTVISTGFTPNSRFWIKQQKDYFPSEIQLRLNKDGGAKSERDHPFTLNLLNQLVLTAPNGETYPLAVSVASDTDYALELQIELPGITPNFVSGTYHLNLPKDFAASVVADTDSPEPPWQYRQLESDETLYSFEYSKTPKFIGFMCSKNGEYALINSRFMNANPQMSDILYSMPCPPSNLSFAFSRRVLTIANDLPPESMPLRLSIKPPAKVNKTDKPQLDWLEGPEYDFSSAIEDKNMFIYRVNLQGFSRYTLKLSRVRYSSDEALPIDQAKIQFMTPPPIPQWQFSAHNGTVIEPDTNVSPVFVRTNIKDMRAQFVPLATAETLLIYLNGDPENKLDRQTISLPPTEESPHKPSLQNIDVKSVLKKATGLVSVELSGSSAASNDIRYGNNATETLTPKKENFIANVAGFNLVVRHNQDLLIQAIDWHAVHIANAPVQLVCESQKAPLLLGQTNQQGVLLLAKDKWQSIYQPYRKNACWIWLEHALTQQSAAIALPLTNIDAFSNLSASTYTAQPIYQPGDKVNIGFFARERLPHSKTNALAPMQNLADFAFSLLTPNKQVQSALTFEALSPMGFSQTEIILPARIIVGDYAISMQHKATGDTQIIGKVTIAEFTPPEFEQTVTVAELINYDEKVTVEVLARRMNGVALMGAKANLRMQMQSPYAHPDSWPKAYEYSSYKEFNKTKKSDANLKNPHSLASSELNTKALSKLGRTTFLSAHIQSKVPFGVIKVSNEVIADDGQANVQDKNVYYVGRDYLIGHKHNKEADALELIAITANGEQASNIATRVSFLQRQVPAGQTKARNVKIGECTLASLPATCSLADYKGSIDIEIDSFAQATQNATAMERGNLNNPQYKWYRNTYKREVNDKEKEDELSVTMSTDKEQYKVGEKISLNARSTVSGTATLVLEAGTIQKVWQQAIEVGDNAIELTALAQWLPNAQVYLSVPVSREEVAKFIDKQNANNAEHASRRFSQNNWERNRLLSSTSQFVIAPLQDKPGVNIKISSATTADNNTPNEGKDRTKNDSTSTNEVAAGSDITIEVSAYNDKNSSQQTETQLWLVNEALWSLTNTESANFDVSNALYTQWAFSQYLQTQSLNEDLVINADLSSISNNRTRGFAMMNRAGISVSNDSEDKLGIVVTGSKLAESDYYNGQSSALTLALSQLSKDDFAQSKWLGQLTLDNAKTQQIKVKLPQLIGRWKVVALSANEHHTAVTTASLNTIRKREYFVDAPRTMLSGDSARFAITQINNSDDAQQDVLSLWLNGELLKKIDIQLAANESKRLEINLPVLNEGQQLIALTSAQETNYVALHSINVKSNKIAQRLSWIQGASDGANKDNTSFEIAMPPSAITGSIELLAVDSDNLQANWPALVTNNMNYRYMCWEQNISRALAYQNAPTASITWPDGFESLKFLLSKQALFTDYNGNYSYYPNQAADPFLSAYTYLVHAWLKDTPLSFAVNEEQLSHSLRAYIKDSRPINYEYLPPPTFAFKENKLNQSMALLALASNQQITLQEALVLRQQIGSSANVNNASAGLLQGLALKVLGANKAVYETSLNTFTQNTYQDTYSNIFNQNSDKCFAAMLFDNGSVEQTAVVQEVLSEQAKIGHFGSTFANAVCTQMLTKFTNVKPRIDAIQKLEFAINNDQIIATSQKVNAQATIYTMTYLQDLNTLDKVSKGINLTKELWVKRGDNWLALSANDTLQIGDLVKTELSINSAKERTHIAAVDAIAGGFEAVNPSFSNQMYSESLDTRWYLYNNITIEEGEVHWQLNYLRKGITRLTYYSRVRHSGEFTMPPAKVEAMYRTDIEASTKAMKVQID